MATSKMNDEMKMFDNKRKIIRDGLLPLIIHSLISMGVGISYSFNKKTSHLGATLGIIYMYIERDHWSSLNIL